MSESLSKLAALADRYYATKETRLAKQKEVDDLQAEETALKNELIASISKDNATGVAGKLVRVTVVTKPKPQVKDWDAFLTHIRRRGAWDLLQRRPSETAIKARWEDGKTIPGVEVFNVVDLSVNKL
jgi:K+-sensing histidine kinase KdpD